jgi:hypothetical protein
MAEKKNQPPVGGVATGLVIKDQGKVSYNGPKTVTTPQVAKAQIKTGVKRGMGAALRDDGFISC